MRDWVEVGSATTGSGVKEAPDQRLVEASPHVDQAQRLVVFVSRESVADVGPRGDRNLP